MMKAQTVAPPRASRSGKAPGGGDEWWIELLDGGNHLLNGELMLNCDG